MPTQGDQLNDPFKLELIAALAFLVWDILITLDQEVEAVWTKPNKFYTKWLFFFVRYFAVAMQVALLFVGTRIAFSLHYTYSDCVKWYVFQEVGTQALIAAVEFILIVRVHALYDRSRIVTSILVLLFIAENIVMIVTLVRVVPEIGFDRICTVVHSPPRLLLFAVAFVSFETVLFILTLFKFIVALRNGWGRTPVLYLLVRDGTWAFILIFGSRRLSSLSPLFSHSPVLVTLCVNASFYLAAGDSPNSSIAFPWLLSIEAFAGARIVLNLHALSFDVSADSSGSYSGAGALSSHIVFTANPSTANHPRTADRRWDWGGLQESSYDSSRSRSGGGTGTRIDTGTIAESYEMTWAGASKSDPDASFHRVHRLGKGASTSATNCTSRCTHSDVCAEIKDEGVA
ncbi:hypothetical protein EDB92DRAFT_1949136 [Lactarius akahatsu]|uniref:DUF6533 domain-containing protein n=1 Tax=Lactarius akahatsu TaxID=416441 RepID=A0AAD4Q5P9_9AGAM|nr:hypothetical protein EDB92DRAFT_1949136 [Lactarius akahatsu]